MKKIFILFTVCLLALSSCDDDKKLSGENGEVNENGSVAGETQGSQMINSPDDPENEGVQNGSSPDNKGTQPGQASKSTKKGIYDGTPINMHVEGMIMGGGRADVLLHQLFLSSRKSIASNSATPEGRWGFDYRISTPGVFALQVPAGSIHFVAMPGDTIFITSDLQSVRNYEVEGSQPSVQLLEMYYILEKANEKKDAVDRAIDSAKRQEDKSWLLRSKGEKYAAIEVQKHKDLRNFIERIDNSFTAILAAFYLDPASSKDMPVIEKVVNQLGKLYPENEYLLGLKEKMSVYLPVSVGKIAPEIQLEEPSGKSIRLTDLRGKYVLIDFWASWCGPCRAENPNMKKVYEKYKNKGQGFEIFGVSLDEKKADWLNAIEEDKLPWKHGSDMLGYKSAAPQTYVVTSIPNTFLLDPQGKIIEKDIRSAELDKILAKLLK